MDLENVRPSWIRIWEFRGVPGFPQEITENERGKRGQEKGLENVINFIGPEEKIGGLPWYHNSLFGVVFFGKIRDEKSD